MKKLLIGSIMTLASTASFGVLAAAVGTTERGIASYYHDSLHGRRTASGQIYNKHRMTAAHRTLPLGTKVRVTDLTSGESIKVTVNDRGPFVRGRVIDLSRSAAKKLDMIERGLTRVRVEVVATPDSDA